MNAKLSRRGFLKSMGALTSGTLLSACAPKTITPIIQTITPTIKAVTPVPPTVTPTITETTAPPSPVPQITVTPTWTSLRRRGDGYPKIGWMFANHDLAGDTSPQNTALYDLIVDYNLFDSLSDTGMRAVRLWNTRFIGLKAQNTFYVDNGDAILSAPGFSEDYLIHFLDASQPCGPSSRATFPGWAWDIYLWDFTNPDAVNFRAAFVVQEWKNLKLQHPDFYNGLFLDGTHVELDWSDWFPQGTTLDIACSGVSDPRDTKQNMTPLWRQGILKYLSSIRNALPDIVILCNDAISYPADFPAIHPLINGVESEGGLAYYLDHYPNAEWQNTVLGSLQYWSQHGVQPRVSLAISDYSSTPKDCSQFTQAELIEDGKTYSRMRFGLTTSLMTGAYYLYELNSYYCAQNRYWYDEYDNAGTQQPGYLGSPIKPSYQVTKNGAATGVYRRDFQNGIALCNPTNVAKTIDLGKTFYRIRGVQDPVQNNGQPTTQVSLGRMDGIILLNEPARG